MNKKLLTSAKDLKAKGFDKEICAEVKLKKKGGKKRYIQAYAGTIGKDRAKDNITIEAWKKAAKDLLQSGAKTIFYNHHTDIPIGLVVKTSVDKTGLLVTGMISKAKDVEDYWTKIKEGVLNAMSVRLKPSKVEVIEDKDGRIEEYKIKELELFEVSVVGLPMNPRATINQVIEKSFDPKQKSHRRKKMARKKVDKQTALEMLEEMLPDAIEGSESFKGLKKSQDQLANSVSQLCEMFKSASRNVMSEEDRKKAEEEEQKKAAEKLKQENPELATVMEFLAQTNSKVDSLADELTKRKGSQEDDGDDNDDDDGTPKKVLKNAGDPDTLKFVVHAMKNADVFAQLNDDEKQLARDIYMQTLLVKLAS